MTSEEWLQKNVCEWWKAYSRTLGGTVLLIWDSARQHLTQKMKDFFRKCNTLVCVIPAGLTAHTQIMDTVLFAHWRRIHQRLYDNIALPPKTAAGRRVLLTSLVSQAMEQVMAQVDIMSFAQKTGYVGWADDPEGKRLRLRAFPDYRFNRNEEVYTKLLERKEAEEAARQKSPRGKATDTPLPLTPPKPNMKQSTLSWGPPPQKRRRQ
jgi:hypothetical protein